MTSPSPVAHYTKKIPFPQVEKSNRLRLARLGHSLSPWVYLSLSLSNSARTSVTIKKDVDHSQRGEAGDEMPQRPLTEDQSHTANLVAPISNLFQSFDNVIEMLLSVDTPGNGQAH